jgi:hypothetical protein
MIDIQRQSEILLREAGFKTATRLKSSTCLCFENTQLFGFVFIFGNCEEMISEWQIAQKNALAEYSEKFRMAGQKAWNIYSIFLTSDSNASLINSIEKIEENLNLTRKIARNGVINESDLNNALLPLLPIRSKPQLAEGDYEAKLETRLAGVAPGFKMTFLKKADPNDIANFLMETP